MTRISAALPVVAITSLGLAACTPTGFDLDLRDNLGMAFDTSHAVQQGVAERPKPDARGVITYPDYQVVVAQRGDTVEKIAARLGQNPQAISDLNGMPAQLVLRRGEIVALPGRVQGAETARTTTAAAAPQATQPIPQSGAITTTTLDERASAAIDRADTGGAQPVRHRVARGETAFSISRRYGVPPAALSEWNGLDAQMTVREGAILLIPPVDQRTAAAPATVKPSQPGQGTLAPPPPSAAAPLPAEKATQAPVKETPPSPVMQQQTTAASASDSRLGYPVQGRVIRAYSKGKNDGVDIAAPAGTAVKAAGTGTVAAITRDTEQVPILVLRHPGNLLTVYAGVADITVTKGDSVSRGQPIAKIRPGDPAFLHFEVREGFESVDPSEYLD